MIPATLSDDRENRLFTVHAGEPVVTQACAEGPNLLAEYFLLFGLTGSQFAVHFA